MKKLKLLFSIILPILLSFPFVGCGKNEKYNSILIVGDAMLPTIGNSQTIYYKSEKKYTNNDIVVISNIDNQYVENESVPLVKRIIATPNQTINFYFIEEKNNKCIYDIKVYDIDNNEIKLFKSDGVSEKKIEKDNSYLDDGIYYKTIFGNIINDSLPTEKRIYSFTLSGNEYFVIGDNYNYSYDSRNYGPIEGKDILGKVDLEYNE